MTAKFDKLLSEDLKLPEATRDLIKEAWDAQIKDATEELTSVLREEFARNLNTIKVFLLNQWTNS